jgi:hypothetical protein
MQSEILLGGTISSCHHIYWFENEKSMYHWISVFSFGIYKEPFICHEKHVIVLLWDIL